MKNAMKMIEKLCTPAWLYFMISFISIIIIGIQNIGNTKKYCVGRLECVVGSTLGVFVVKMLYVIFWTWFLNVFCRAGYTNVAWFILLFPLILGFLIIALLLLKAL